MFILNTFVVIVIQKPLFVRWKQSPSGDPDIFFSLFEVDSRNEIIVGFSPNLREIVFDVVVLVCCWKKSIYLEYFCRNCYSKTAICAVETIS